MVNDAFRKTLCKTKADPESIRYLKACRQIENLICTHRESLLGSSAWKPDFLNQLRVSDAILMLNNTYTIMNDVLPFFSQDLSICLGQLAVNVSMSFAKLVVVVRRMQIVR